jgi:hypothetical protein
MFSSAKFLSPSVTVGLPAPGPVEAELAGVLLELELLVDFELLPHAASTKPASTAASTVPARTTPLSLFVLLSSIRRLLVVHFVNGKGKL